MNRRPIKVILLSPAITGALCVVLAIMTGTGTTGAYVFLFLAIPILLLYLMWPERTRFFVGDSATSRRFRSGAGEEITPEIADALAAEAEHGYDLSKAKRRPVGQKRAKKGGRSVRDLAREAVARYVGS